MSLCKAQGIFNVFTTLLLILCMNVSSLKGVEVSDVGICFEKRISAQICREKIISCPRETNKYTCEHLIKMLKCSQPLLESNCTFGFPKNLFTFMDKEVLRLNFPKHNCPFLMHTTLSSPAQVFLEKLKKFTNCTIKELVIMKNQIHLCADMVMFSGTSPCLALSKLKRICIDSQIQRCYSPNSMGHVQFWNSELDLGYYFLRTWSQSKETDLNEMHLCRFFSKLRSTLVDLSFKFENELSKSDCEPEVAKDSSPFSFDFDFYWQSLLSFRNKLKVKANSPFYCRSKALGINADKMAMIVSSARARARASWKQRNYSKVIDEETGKAAAITKYNGTSFAATDIGRKLNDGKAANSKEITQDEIIRNLKTAYHQLFLKALHSNVINHHHHHHSLHQEHENRTINPNNLFSNAKKGNFSPAKGNENEFFRNSRNETQPEGMFVMKYVLLILCIILLILIFVSAALRQFYFD